LVSGKPPRRSVTLPPPHPRRRRYLNTFRGEPAISGFAWHFTPTHRSSRWFAIHPGPGLHERVPPASPCPWVAHPVSGRVDATSSPFRTRVRSGSSCPRLSLAAPTHSSAHSTKGTPSPLSGLRPARGARFQALFHSPWRGAFHRSLTVLVPYRSPAVFSLGRWSAPLPTRFRVSGGTHATGPLDPHPRRLRGSHPLRPPVPAMFGCGSASSEESVTPSSLPVQPPDDSASGLVRRPGLGFSPFARRYSGNPLASSGY